MILSDTIVAISSSGGGLRAIVRLSGDAAHALAAAVTDLPLTHDRGWFGDVSLRCLASENRLASVLLFKAPHSFTGQDIAELHLPNSPALTRTVIADILNTGRQKNIAVRPADPGEFSARAFFNGKIDLTEAEGIAATINAANESQLKAAASLRHGTLHKEVDRISNKIADMLSRVEAGIDFADEEDVSFIDPEAFESHLEQLGERMQDLVTSGFRVERYDALPTVVFLGLPNVGKSSLINALVGSERSIVSPIAGTTRDILAALMHTPTGDIRLIDVPGEEPATDELRRKMMEARGRALLEADLVIFVVDDTERAASHCIVDGDHDFFAPHISVQNKADLLLHLEPDDGWWLPGTGRPRGQVSARTGFQINKLREVIVRLVTRHEVTAASQIVVNQRHIFIMKELQWSFWHAAGILRDPDTYGRHPELLAAELRHALDLLGQITGTISPDEVLGRIFSQFCIGK